MTDRHPRHDRLAVASIVITLIAAACGSSTSSPSASPTSSPTPNPTPTAAPSATPAGSVDPSEADAIYDTIEEQVIAMRDLQPTAEVQRETIDETELGTMIRQMYAEESPPELVAANERLYKALGLLPADASLEDLTIELLSGGVAGFYRHDEKKLYVVSKTGAVGVNEKITFAHEFDHALQDQHFTVFADQEKVMDRSDWIMARQAVYEGDATLLMSLWASENFTPQEFGELLQAGQDDESAAMLERMPAILRETLLYPYTTGLVFAQTEFLTGGWEAVDALYADMPESTEQILHGDKWQAREAPVEVDLPEDLATDLGAGWKVAMEDTFGEFQLGIWLRETGADAPTEAAAGWGGDRAGVLNGPNGSWAVVLATEWDSAAEAAEFEAAAQTSVASLGGSAALLPGAAGTSRWVVIASDDAALGIVAGALGLAG